MTAVKPGTPSFYSAAQVQTYLQRIDFLGDISSFTANLKNLKQLIKLHLIAFPYENTDLHYSASHEVDVSPSFVYSRLVEQRKGGTWCFGQNGLFLGMLRGLGYRGYACSSRVNRSANLREAKEFSFFTHLVLIVQLDDESHEEDDQVLIGSNSNESIPRPRSYLVDVGYSPVCPVRPIPLEIGHIVRGAAPPEEYCLVKGIHPNSSLQESDATRNWVLQYRCGSHQPDWVVLHHFTESESFPSDWIAYSQWFSAYPVAKQLNNVICIRYFVLEYEDEEEKGDKVLGRLVMGERRVQKRVGARSETVKEFTTERERVRILKEDFGIMIDQDDIRNIAHRPAALHI